MDIARHKSICRLRSSGPIGSGLYYRAAAGTCIKQNAAVDARDGMGSIDVRVLSQV